MNAMLIAEGVKELEPSIKNVPAAVVVIVGCVLIVTFHLNNAWTFVDPVIQAGPK